MIYNCCVRQKKCRSILKHVLKRCDNRKLCRRPVVSLSHATKSYRVNRPLEVYLGRGGTFDCVIRVSSLMAGYSAVKPKHDIPFILVDIQIHRGLGDQNLS